MSIPNDATLISLNRPYVFKGTFPGGFVDQFVRKFPFHRIEQPTTQVSWNLLSSSNAISFYLPDPPSPLPTNPLNFSASNLTLTRVGDSVLVDYFSEVVSGNTNNLLDTEIQTKKVGIIRTLGAQIIQGNGIAPNIKGLQSLVISSQQFSVASTGGVPYLKELNQLVHMVRASDGCVGGGADCIVTHERVLRWILLALAPTYGILEFRHDADLGVSVPYFRGIPIYIGQSEAYDSPLAYDIWALKMSGPTGIRMLHAAGRSEEFGIDVVKIPIQPGSAQLGAFVGGLYGLMVPEAQSIARIQGVLDSTLTSVGIDPLPT